MMDNYTLGILWGCGQYSENRMIVRHSQRYFVEQIQAIFGRTIYEQIGTSGKKQYVLKFRMPESCLLDWGWSPRNAKVRHIPAGSDAEFLRAYLEMHSSVSWQTAYTRRDRKKYRKVRLRVYGNFDLINEINLLISEVCGVSLKTPQKTEGETTTYLSFASQQELSQIYDTLHRQPCYDSFWKKYFEMMQEYALIQKNVK